MNESSECFACDAAGSLPPPTPVMTGCPPLSKNKLTEEEQRAWIKDINTIRSGLEAYFEAGEALREIKNRKLYREEYSSWEEFSIAVAGWSKTHANRLMQASEVVRDLREMTPIGVIGNGKPERIVLPANESQARPLAKLNGSEQRRKAWKIIVERTNGAPITAELIQTVVDEVGGKKPKTPATRTRNEKKNFPAETKSLLDQVLADLRSAIKTEDWSLVKKATDHLRNAANLAPEQSP